MGIYSGTSWAKPRKLTEVQLLSQDIKARIAASHRTSCDVHTCRRPVGKGNTNWKVRQYDGCFILLCPTCDEKVNWGDS